MGRNVTIVGCILTGLGWLAIAPTATASYFGTCDYPRCYGVVFLAFGAGAIAGPQLAGFIRTTTGNYVGVFPCVFIMAIIGFFIMYPDEATETKKAVSLPGSGRPGRLHSTRDGITFCIPEGTACSSRASTR